MAQFTKQQIDEAKVISVAKFDTHNGGWTEAYSWLSKMSAWELLMSEGFYFMFSVTLMIDGHSHVFYSKGAKDYAKNLGIKASQL